jgi:divalent metal cation (Fe/Co/Zn/Cd) transporter
LTSCCSNKLPKICIVALEAVHELLETYGTTYITPESIAQILVTPGILDHKDINVRKAGLALAVELHRWINEDITTLLDTLSDVLMKEINNAISSSKVK